MKSIGYVIIHFWLSQVLSRLIVLLLRQLPSSPKINSMLNNFKMINPAWTILDRMQYAVLVSAGIYIVCIQELSQ